MALLSPPPPCFKDFCEETSQQVPAYSLSGHVHISIANLQDLREERKGR